MGSLCTALHNKLMVNEIIIYSVSCRRKGLSDPGHSLFSFVGVKGAFVINNAVAINWQKFGWVVFVIFVCDFLNHVYILAQALLFVKPPTVLPVGYVFPISVITKNRHCCRLIRRIGVLATHRLAPDLVVTFNYIIISWPLLSLPGAFLYRRAP